MGCDERPNSGPGSSTSHSRGDLTEAPAEIVQGSYRDHTGESSRSSSSRRGGRRLAPLAPSVHTRTLCPCLPVACPRGTHRSFAPSNSVHTCTYTSTPSVRIMHPLDLVCTQ